MSHAGRAVAVLICAVVPALAQAQTGRNVLVVANAASPASVRIAEYYADRRAVPLEQVLHLSDLPADPPDGIDRPTFERAIQAPIARWLNRHQAQDRILFIVLTKGIPLRINDSAASKSAASVDSELAVLYLRLTGASVPLAGPLPNPYFLGDRPIAGAKRFAREDQSIYLVTRLDGYTVEDVLALIDRGAAPSSAGRFILDAKGSWSDKGNDWLREAAERLTAAGLPEDRVLFDQGTTVVTDQDDVLGYYSWGSNDPAIRRRQFNLSFRPGAIGGMFVSTDGRTFREPPEDWAIGTWNNRSKWFAGSPQSLAGDLIREGITGVAGHVSEPLLGHTVRPNVLFPSYFSGFTLAESFYLAMPSLSWMTVVVGDPLCAPFGRAASAVTDAAIDPATELPASFSRRRLATITAPNLPQEAAKIYLRANVRAWREERVAMRADLERVIGLAPDFLPARRMLAEDYGAADEHERAISAYEEILAKVPNDVPALNNLAYALAVHQGDLRRALPPAERAYKLAPQSGAVADTLGLILLLSGEARRSLQLLQEAVRRVPDSGEIHLHLAQALAATGDFRTADVHLAKALELDSALATRPEVGRLRETIDSHR